MEKVWEGLAVVRASVCFCALASPRGRVCQCAAFRLAIKPRHVVVFSLSNSTIPLISRKHSLEEGPYHYPSPIPHKLIQAQQAPTSGRVIQRAGSGLVGPRTGHGQQQLDRCDGHQASTRGWFVSPKPLVLGGGGRTPTLRKTAYHWTRRFFCPAEVTEDNARDHSKLLEERTGYAPRQVGAWGDGDGAGLFSSGLSAYASWWVLCRGVPLWIVVKTCLVVSRYRTRIVGFPCCDLNKPARRPLALAKVCGNLAGLAGVTWNLEWAILL